MTAVTLLNSSAVAAAVLVKLHYIGGIYRITL